MFLPPLEPEAAPGGASSRGAPARMAAGRRPAAASPSVAASPTGLPGESLAAIAAPPAEAAEALEALQGALASTVEAAFFDALADGLRRGETARLAALLVDARDQLGALLPQSQAAAVGQQQGGGGSSGEGQVLLAELQEKLDAVRAAVGQVTHSLPLPAGSAFALQLLGRPLARRQPALHALLPRRITCPSDCKPLTPTTARKPSTSSCTA